MEKEASGCNQKDVDLITEKVAGNLVVKENQSFSDSLKESSTAFVNLSDTPYIPASMSNCPENYCRTSCCSKHVLPLGFTPKPVKPASVKRVEFKEHDNKQDIEVEGHGKVTVNYTNYESEKQMKDIISLITKDLSEPYSIYTYRYFIHNWPKLSFLAYVEETCVGAIVCKLDIHKKMTRRGYIAMLAVDDLYRRHQIGSNLVIKAIKKMIEIGCDEVVLETEITNVGALRLYENLGFVRDKRLFKYYLNGVDALRLKLWLR